MTTNDPGLGAAPDLPDADIDEQWERVEHLFQRTGPSPLFDLVLAVFEEQEVDHQLPDPDLTIVRAMFQTDEGDVDVWVRTHEEHHTVSVRSVVPANLPADRSAAMTLAARANRNVEVGSYELDPEDGPLTFKTSLDVEDGELTVPLFRNMVGTALVAAEVMAPLLNQVANGRDPLKAGAEV